MRDPDVTLAAMQPRSGDRIGSAGATQGLHLADVTGDGRLDLIAGAIFADAGGVLDSGAVFVWSWPGPAARELASPDPRPNDLLGQ